jgi:hypothetical protein
MSNTLYFVGLPGPSVEDDIAEIDGRLQAFYNAIDNLIYPGAVVGTTMRVLQYNMGDPEPRVPINENTFGITVSGSAAYPSDVCICLSYHGDYVSGANRARRRGRIYLGPLIATTAVAVTGQGQRVNPTLVGQILDAAELLATTQLTSLLWSMYSETDNQAWPIVECSVDNGFDTRRSRDNRATTRVTRAIA